MARDEAYREAERRIEEAQVSGAAELSLRHIGLTTLPESLGQLTQLQTLDLRRNQLTSLPESLGQLVQLQTLKLRRNDLTKLLESLGQLAQLQTLGLSGNQLTSLPESLGQLTQLQTLDLSGNQLTSLPESLGQLTQLQTLDLTGNQLTSLPDSLGQLTQLQRLYLGYNQLTSLPESLGQLTQLQTLNLGVNRLTSLPESLGQLTQLQTLDLGANRLTSLPEWLGQGAQLQTLDLRKNKLTSLPESLGQFTQLQALYLYDNQLASLPEALGQLTQLQVLNLSGNQLKLTSLPESLGQLTQLQTLNLGMNQLTSLPESLGQLTHLQTLDLGMNQLTSLPESLGLLMLLLELDLGNNPLNPELAAAYEQGTDMVLAYLRAEVDVQIVLSEAKLILIGEGEVGKSSLLGALRGDPWIERRPTTHGIEILPADVTEPESETTITLNGWDFGGQPVYRPTHQLFFSAPAVYLVVWKPREGPQQGFVKEWIKLIKHREPDAEILVVATHGGPRQRQPDINRQEILDEFGSETVVDFFHVDCRPPHYDEENDRWYGECPGIENLKARIAKVAAELPEVGRSVPAKWQQARETLNDGDRAWMKYDEFVAFCGEHGMDATGAELFAKISHTLGHLIHYDYDTKLREIVILKPDWLAKAVSFVLDDPHTRENYGLVDMPRLHQLWNDPLRDGPDRYPLPLHEAFVRLMERFDLSYEVELEPVNDDGKTILVAQLVPEAHAGGLPQWGQQPEVGDAQQVQICRIVDDRGQSAAAEGLFYQLIVRLHKYSLGRADYHQSVHWQRGLMVDDDYNGRALLEHIGNDIRITVRAAYPERFLSALTSEVKWLVESFWEGLRCEVMVPCAEPCGKNQPGLGLFEVEKLIASKRKGRHEYPCHVAGCDQWQDIDHLLRNAPAARAAPTQEMLIRQFDAVRTQLGAIREQLKMHDRKGAARFRALDQNDRRIMSQADEHFELLIQTLTDEAKEGPRLFSFEAVTPGFFDRPNWIAEKFRLTLWCERARVPLPVLNEDDDHSGVYELELTREWVKKAAPFLKGLTTTLSLVLPVASSATKLLMDDHAYKRIEKQLDFGLKCADSFLKGGEKAGTWLARGDDAPEMEHGRAMRAEGAMLRELQVMLKERDPAFGGLVRVQNKRREFLWVHPQFVDEY